MTDLPLKELPLSRLIIEGELEKATKFIRDNLRNGHRDMIPPSMLVIAEQKERPKIFSYELPELTDPPSVSVAMIREQLGNIGAAIGQRRNVHPVCVITMIEVVGLSLEDWIAELQERRAELLDRDTYGESVVITAADETGYQVRQQYELEDVPNSETIWRRLGRSRELATMNEASELDAFWEAFRASRCCSSGQGFGRLRL